LNATLIQRFQNYLEQHSLSPATIRNYLADLRAFARWQALWGGTPAAVSAADVGSYRDYLTAETAHSPATVNRRLQSLRLFGRFLLEMGHMPENPARDLALVPSENGNGNGHVPRTLSEEETKKLKDSIKSGRPSLIQRDYAIMQVMLHAGLRVHEVAELEMRDVVQTPRGMFLEILSNGSGTRTVPLDAVAARALRDYLAVRPGIPNVAQVFVSQRGKPLSMRSVQRSIDNYARAAGLDDVCAQTLRHTCAKNLLMKKNATHVARILGHHSLKALDRYSLKSSA
jgi:site-specific recombinase XerD